MSNVKNPGLALVKHQGRIGRYFDKKMEPLMYWLQATKNELPQRTHFWNNYKFRIDNHPWLDSSLMAHAGADKKARRRKLLGFIPLFHMPRFGGWTRYVVLCPAEHWSGGSWFVGWTLGNGKAGVSKIPLNGPVKCLVGDLATTFFAIDARGNQLSLQITGVSNIGNGMFTEFPLL